MRVRCSHAIHLFSIRFGSFRKDNACVRVLFEKDEGSRVILVSCSDADSLDSLFIQVGGMQRAYEQTAIAAPKTQCA